MIRLLFLLLPWLSAAALLIGFAWRVRSRAEPIGPRATQQLESRLLRLGTLPLHAAVLALLLGHLGFLFAGADRLLTEAGAGVRLGVEATGIAAGLLCGAGVLVLGVRRRISPRVRAVTRASDLLVLALLFIQAASGVWVAASSRWVSIWAPPLVTPWLHGALTLHPDPEVIVALPSALQLHLATGLVLLALVPFTRLAHVVALPLTILERAWRALRRRGFVRPEKPEARP